MCSLYFAGKVLEVLIEARVREAKQFKYQEDTDFINGLPGFYLEMRQHFSPLESKMVDLTISETGKDTQISFKQLTPGSVLVLQ